MFKLKLFHKIMGGYIIAVILIGILSATIVLRAYSFQKTAALSANEVLPNTLMAKDLQMHVVQVQQWLTDISATRGAEGYDDGYDEAAEHAKAFTEDVAKFKDYYQSMGNMEKVQELDELQKEFDDYYEVGKKMAANYIEFGPEKGNEYMEIFDPYAEKVTDDVNAFVDEQSTLLTANMHSISSDSARLMWISGTISTISAIIMIILGAIIARLITKPIHNFTDILRDIAQGEGDLTHRIKSTTNDEIADMATYFNQTFEKIRLLVATVQDQAKMLNQVGEDLSSNMTETASAVNEISSNIVSIKNQTVTQSSSVAETSSTMEQISNGIGNLSSLIKEQTINIGRSSSAIEELIKNISDVSTTLVNNTENIRRLEESSQAGKTALDNITAAIQEVSKESKGLMEISQVIQAIASQTNLLAMNAAIEAAHAGESGKGFAVVADEVRKLAESSSTQTKTITEILKKITDSISIVITISENVVEQFASIEKEIGVVAQQEGNIRTSMEVQAESSKQVHESIGLLQELTQKVQNSSAEMLEGSQRVTDEARSMNSITQEITGGMNEMATGAEQINKAVNSVNELTVENKQSIDALTAEVNKFKV